MYGDIKIGYNNYSNIVNNNQFNFKDLIFQDINDYIFTGDYNDVILVGVFAVSPTLFSIYIVEIGGLINLYSNRFYKDFLPEIND